MANKPFALSVVIATYNRELGLEKCIRALADQTISSFNLVIINDSGTTVHRQTILDLLRAHPNIKLTIINNQNNAGSAAVRNQGFAKAPQGLVVFTDDDAIAEPNWLETIQNYFQKYPQTVVLNGRIKAVSVKHLSERLRQAYYDYRDAAYSRNGRNALLASQYGIRTTAQNLTDWISLGNCAMKKTPDGIMQPPFDATLTRNYSHKLAKRLMREGKIVSYSTKPQIRHDHGRGFWTVIAIRRRNGINFCAVDDSNQTTIPERLRECRRYLNYMLFSSSLSVSDKIIELLLSILFICSYAIEAGRRRLFKKSEEK